VSEKAAALEVVQTRLEHAGLSEFVLELHSHKATRKHVAQTLGRALTTRLISKGRFPEIELQRLIANRRELTEYARAMNEPREPLGRSVHAVLGDLGRLQHLPQAPTTEAIGTSLSAAQFASICDVADALGRAWGPVERGSDFLWRSLENGTLTQGRRAFLISALDRATVVLKDVADLTSALAEETNLSWTTDLRDSQRFKDLLTLLATPRNIPLMWLCAPSLQPVTVRHEELALAAQELKGMVDRLTADAGSDWRKLNGSDLLTVETIRSSIAESPLAFLSSELTGGRNAAVISGHVREVSAMLQGGLAGKLNR
jgi:hypothetical protein